MIADTIKKFIVDEYLPDATVAQLESSYDLFSNGVIDSLGLLRFVSWLEQRFDVPIDDVEIVPDNFRTVAQIAEFIERANGAAKKAASS
jgi:acyl carrier protein